MMTGREFVIRPGVGGRVSALQQRDGRIDLSLIAPQGPSAAVYLTVHELGDFALDFLAHALMESGMEIGDMIEERRALSPPGTGGQT